MNKSLSAERAALRGRTGCLPSAVAAAPVEFCCSLQSHKRRGGERREFVDGEGDTPTNWDPDVMADNVNPCCLAEGIFSFSFDQGGGSREEDGKGAGIWASGGTCL